MHAGLGLSEYSATVAEEAYQFDLFLKLQEAQAREKGLPYNEVKTDQLEPRYNYTHLHIVHSDLNPNVTFLHHAYIYIIQE